ncbi:AEC family transporter [Rhodocyclaceae bacterium SMB388]
MLIRIVAILFPMFAIAALGYWIGRRLKPDMAHANKLNMDVFLPALIFAALVNRDMRVTDYFVLSQATLIIVIATGLAGWGLAHLSRIPARTLVPPMMFPNTGNLALPLAVLAFGESALAPAVVIFMTMNLVHFTFGAWLLDHRVRLWTVWKIPSVLATLLGLAVAFAGIDIWPPLLTAIRMVGDISVPLMLFALGVRLNDSRITSVGKGMFVGIARPMVGMAISWSVLLMFDLPPEQHALVFVFGALPPAVLNYMFAERYHQDPETVASMVLIGNLLAPIFLMVALAIVLP